jgi:hypothetical protein
VTIAAFQAVGTGSETSCAWPTHATNDLGLLFVQYGAGTVTTPSGWTILPNSQFVHSTEGMAVFYKFAASGAEGAASLAGATDHMWGVILTVRNAHLTSPFYDIVGFRQLGSQTTAIGATSYTLIDDLLVVEAFGVIADNAGPNASGETNSDLGSLTERYDAGTVTANGGSLVIYTGTKVAPGAIGPTTIGTLTSSAWSGVRIVIAPIADETIAGVVTVDGVAVANGESVRAIDLTQPAASYLCTVGTTGSGTGAFTILAPYLDHDYQAVYEDGTNYGASAVDQAV